MIDFFSQNYVCIYIYIYMRTEGLEAQYNDMIYRAYHSQCTECPLTDKQFFQTKFVFRQVPDTYETRVAQKAFCKVNKGVQWQAKSDRLYSVHVLDMCDDGWGELFDSCPVANSSPALLHPFVGMASRHQLPDGILSENPPTSPTNIYIYIYHIYWLEK